jgi:hypothetical protein
LPDSELQDDVSGGRSEWRSNPPESIAASASETRGADADAAVPATPPNATVAALAVLLGSLPPEAKAALRELLKAED